MLKVLARRLSWIVAAVACGTALGQGTSPESKGVAERRVQATALRDSFVEAIVAAGMSCPIAPPKIVVRDVPSYGNYDSVTNTLTTSAWDQLTGEEKSGFFRMLGPGTTEEAARAEFEIGVHRWVFVHEMGHWWQACRKVPETGSGYAIELGANRVAAAYWQVRDSSIIAHQHGVFELIQSHVPSPVPAGQRVETYFDMHYPDKFGSMLEYIWFQARMCLAVFDEKPRPTFAQALKDISPSK